jgi:septal ring factor EnvC (AmiA/AmiB activator)
MHKFTRKVTTIGVTVLFSGSLFLFGCSSGPDDAQLKQLQDLKDETAQLEKEVKEKTTKKAELDRVVAEKNAKLKKCNDDQQIVKQRLAK